MNKLYINLLITFFTCGSYLTHANELQSRIGTVSQQQPKLQEGLYQPDSSRNQFSVLAIKKQGKSFLVEALAIYMVQNVAHYFPLRVLVSSKSENDYLEGEGNLQISYTNGQICGYEVRLRLHITDESTNRIAIESYQPYTTPFFNSHYGCLPSTTNSWVSHAGTYSPRASH